MKKFIIYGAAAIGNIAKGSLEKSGGQILGYIDKRAYELETYNQLPVWSVDDVPELYVSDEVMVFVGVKNVYEHEKIFRILKKRGFRYIVYKPYSVLLGHGTKEEELISNAYDMLFQASAETAKIELPVCTINEQKSLHDYALLNESDTKVTAYIPAEFICTNNYLQGGMMKWGNINILSFFTHIDFFRFLDHREDASPQAYLEEYCVYTAGLQKKIVVTDAWKENVIKNRTQIYEKMSESMNLDSDYFIRNAPEAVWNDERKIFNLTSGKHRSTFLAAKGVKYIPLKISKADYYKFYHKDEVLRVKELLIALDDDIMIPHPCFYRDDRSADKSAYAFLLWFARYYGRKNFYKYGKVMFQYMKIMDWSDDLGYLARFLTRLGCEVRRFTCPTELEKQLNQLFYASLTYKSDDNSLYEKCDICIIDEHRVDKILPFQNQYENLIIKCCTKDRIEDICNIMDRKVILKVTEQYEHLELKGTYLLGHREE